MIGTRSSFARWAFLAPFAVLLAIILLVQAALMAIDPFGEFPWTPPREIPAGGPTPNLFQVAAKNEYDVVVMGGSTTIGFRPDDITAVFPDAKKVVNLSYAGSKPLDLEIAYAQVARMPRLKHLILSLDYSMLLPASSYREQFPFEIYEPGLAYKFRATDRTALQAAWAAIAPRQNIDPQASDRKFKVRIDRAYTKWMDAESRRLMITQIPSRRSMALKPSKLRCDDLDSLNQVLMPFVRKMAASGTRIDIFIPPYSAIFYYGLPTKPALPNFDASVYDHLKLRECLVINASSLDKVAVHAFDTPALITSWAKFRGSGHIYHRETYQHLLKSMASGENRVTVKNFDRYAHMLGTTVANYDGTELSARK